MEAIKSEGFQSFNFLPFNKFHFKRPSRVDIKLIKFFLCLLEELLVFSLGGFLVH